MDRPKNIYIIGAQCTGKSTLINAIESHLLACSSSNHPTTPVFIREVARNVVIETGVTRNDIRLSPEKSIGLQWLILKTQYHKETENEGKWLISDRSGLDSIVYASMYSSKDAASELLNSVEWRTLRTQMKEAVVLLCKPVKGWLADDGVRLLPTNLEEWMAMHKVYEDILKTQGIVYTTLGEDLENTTARVEFALRLSKVIESTGQ